MRLFKIVATFSMLTAGWSLALAVPDAQQSPATVGGQRSDDAKPAPHRIVAKHLPNPIRVCAKVVSGGLPEGDAAFQELKALGIKTVVSVDGMTPDVKTARKYGMRYVHLPHGYDGVPADRAIELAKAVRDLEGPIYIHCHHGKHRSPAAASVACVGAGLIPPSQSMAVLKLAGTSPAYRGLFESARTAKPIDPQALDRLNADFPESTKIPPLAAAMVAIDQTNEHLKLIAAAGYDHPKDNHGNVYISYAIFGEGKSGIPEPSSLALAGLAVLGLRKRGAA